MRAAVAGATIDNDPKLEALSELLCQRLGPEKAIIFSYYADTVRVDRARKLPMPRAGRALRRPAVRVSHGYPR